ALESHTIGKTGQNMKFDIGVFANYGIKVNGPLFDTMLAHYLLEPDMRHGMDLLSERYLNYSPQSITELIGKKGTKAGISTQGNMRDVPLNLISDYAAEDADITFRLKKVFAPAITKRGLESLLRDVEIPLMSVLAEMELAGVRIDTGALSELSTALGADALIMEEKIYAAAGERFNISSPKQLGDILFDKMQLVKNAKKTATGQYATGEEVLSGLAYEHEIAGLILEYREVLKLKNTYVDSLPLLISPRDGRLHTNYNQAIAATGRLSSTNPNLQNIPIRTARGREIRKAFIPRDDDHILLSCDYSQIELRIMAAFSEDETMMQAFTDGDDIHSITASKLYKIPLAEVTTDMRRKAKTANFGIIYGISAFGLAQRLQIPRKEAVEIIDSYFAQFPKIKRYMDRVVNEGREQGYVTTILGRRRYLNDINSRNQTLRGYAERNAINAPIQGTAADMIKIAMINVGKAMKEQGLKSHMILQVHDELVFDVYKPELELMTALVPELMRNALPLGVPMDAGVGSGENWLAAH
ncbi:MAG: DNA polymerase I, partial [Bacteroidota bacterium]